MSIYRARLHNTFNVLTLQMSSEQTQSERQSRIFTLEKCELCSGAVNLVGDSELVFVEIVRLHFTDKQTELKVPAAD